jgi:hypothetical protein
MTTASQRADISVIVPTLARRERAAQLLRALDSIVTRAGVPALPIVVVNGADRDPELIAALGRRTDLRLATLEAANLPAALRLGRSLVETPYFAELDDDDWLLPNAFARLREAMDAEPRADIVVGNSIVRDGDERLAMRDITEVSADPLRALVSSNWLVPGAALFRTHRVPARLLDGMPRHLERTYFAVQITARCRLHFIGQALCIHTVAPPASGWAAREVALGLPAALERILELDLPEETRVQFERKLAAACHHAADSELRAGQLASALGWHLRSLFRHGDWRRLPFGRKLVAALWRQQAARPEAG